MQKLYQFSRELNEYPRNQAGPPSLPFKVEKAIRLKNFLNDINVSAAGVTGNVIRKTYKSFLTNVWNKLPRMSEFPDKSKYKANDKDKVKSLSNADIVEKLSDSIHKFFFFGFFDKLIVLTFPPPGNEYFEFEIQTQKGNLIPIAV